MINLINTMNRRPFIKLLSANVIGLPLLGSGVSLFAAKSCAGTWLAQLLEEGQIESISSFWVHDLPQLPQAVKSGEFTASTNRIYFYQQRQFCFQVFEKVHPELGQLELMLPFWKKQADGTWKKIATLNAFDMSALAVAIEHNYTASALLPLDHHPATSSYSCPAGFISIKAKIGEDNRTYTEIEIKGKNQQSWKKHFSSTQNLPSLLF